MSHIGGWAKIAYEFQFKRHTALFAVFAAMWPLDAKEDFAAKARTVAQKVQAELARLLDKYL